ncbi:cytochrome-c peroxidase [Algivirga pacifica]|uniref:Cytochrome c peroxidase n=1 Tax=Algivirga pacifica TaxID=1162670 RepID=A0ABP9CZ11_9BACT
MKHFAPFSLFFSIILLWSCDPDEPSPVNSPYELSIPPHFSQQYILPENNSLTTEGVKLGRMLFYEKGLSRDGSQSCASCHQQEFGFSDPRPLSIGVRGLTGRRHAMALSNLMWERRFFWDGRAETLEAQALLPIQDPLEMDHTLEGAVAFLQGEEKYTKQFEKAFGTAGVTSERIAFALAQFQRTLISDNSPYDRYLRGEYEPTDLELKGIALFETHPIPGVVRGGNCGDCHLGTLKNGDPIGWKAFRNNGLDTDANRTDDGLMEVTGNDFDRGKFKVPSLRNIAVTAPYMHDGRFQTLEEVLDHYNEHIQYSQTLDPLILEASNQPIFSEDTTIQLYLREDEKQAILAFLHMLTDTTFLTNPSFTNPHTP